MSRRLQLPPFPDPVNEVSARMVAAGVAVVAIGAVAAGQLWLVVPLAYGFVARVVAGPRYSPWALIVTRLLVPRLGLTERPVPGRPKRFAQGMGAMLTVTAASALGLGATTLTAGLLLAVAAAASLEAVFAFCLGCRVYALLIRAGLLPERACEACADIRLPVATTP